MTYNEIKEKVLKLDKTVNDHDRKNIEVKANDYKMKNAEYLEAEAEQFAITQGAKAVETFLKLYYNFKGGGACSPKLVFDVLKKMSVIAVGQTEAENRKMVFTMLDDIYFQDEKDQKAFKDWANSLWEKMVPTLQSFEEYGKLDFLNHIKAHEDYIANKEAKKKKGKK